MFKKLKKKLESFVIERRKRGKHLKVTKKLSDYIERLHESVESPADLDILNETWSREHSFLQIPLSEAKFLSLFVRATKARRVLEIGTFRGWSAGFLARTLPPDGLLVTVDHDLRIKDENNELWRKLGVESKIDFRRSRAIEMLQCATESGEVFDLIFIDAEKSEYKEYLRIAYPLLTRGGTILVDNVLWAGLVAKDKPANNGARYMKNFNEYVFKNFGASACLIPAWDGVVMVVK